GVSVALSDHELWLRSPVAHVVSCAKAAHFAQPLFGKICGQRFPRCADETITKKEILIFIRFRVAFGTLRARVGRPDNAICTFWAGQQFQIAYLLLWRKTNLLVS